jgi:Zn-dependent M16 (insulinase) family peptidase
LEEKLEENQKKNTPPIPQELLEKFKIPESKEIKFFPITTYRQDINPETENEKKLYEFINNDKENKLFPYFLQIDHIETSFINFNCYLDTSYLSSDLKLYLELYLELMFELPIINDDGSFVSHENVVMFLNNESIDYSNSLG